jgi:hypothetical protein
MVHTLMQSMVDAAKEHGAYFDAEYGEDSGCWLEAEELDYD